MLILPSSRFVLLDRSQPTRNFDLTGAGQIVILFDSSSDIRSGFRPGRRGDALYHVHQILESQNLGV